MGTRFEHPLAVRAHEGGFVELASGPLVWLSAGRVDLLVTAAGVGRRVVVVSGPGSRLTEAMRDALTCFDGRWVVDDGQQAYDGLTGAVLGSWADIDQPSGTSRAVAGRFLDPPANMYGDVRLVMSWSQRHKADADTVVGGMLEGFLAGLGLAAPAGWGVCEPVTEPWDKAEVTRFARSRMPDPTRVVVVGHHPDTLSATVSVQRTREGVEETVTGLVRVGPIGSDAAQDRLAAVPGVLAGLCESTMPLSAVVMAQTGSGDLAWGPWVPGIPVPVAVLVGPPGVRDLGIDVADAVQHWSALRAGRPKLPALVYPFTDGTDPVAKLRGILAGIDRSRLPEALVRDLGSMGGV